MHSLLGESVTAGMECMLGSAMYLKSTGMSLKNTVTVNATEECHPQPDLQGALFLDFLCHLPLPHTKTLVI